jgi:hypothetical protein
LHTRRNLDDPQQGQNIVPNIAGELDQKAIKVIEA